MVVEVKRMIIEPFLPTSNPPPGNNFEPITVNLIGFEVTIERLMQNKRIKPEQIEVKK